MKELCEVTFTGELFDNVCCTKEKDHTGPCEFVFTFNDLYAYEMDYSDNADYAYKLNGLLEEIEYIASAASKV